MKKHMYCDSSLKELCIVCLNDDKSDIIIKPHPFKVTVNQGEYLAVLKAVEYAFELGVTELEIQTDSLLVAKQVNRSWKCNEPVLKIYRDRIEVLSRQFNSFKLSWTSRETNPAGHILEGRK